MDTFYAFLIFGLLLLLDFFAQQRWLAWYYRFGLPVFRASAPLAGRASSGSDSSSPAQFGGQTPAALEAQFKARPAHPSIQFHLLPGGALAFREKLFENRGGFKYLPVIHSTARLHPQRGEVFIAGRLNLWAIFTLVYILYRSAVEPSFVPVALLALLVLVLSYGAQASINRQVLRELALAAARSGEASTEPGQGSQSN